jgi:hypothetical protein
MRTMVVAIDVPLLLAVTTSLRFITQELWRFPAEEVCSFQAAIFQERFHRFFRGRDSMKGNKEIAVFSFFIQPSETMTIS